MPVGPAVRSLSEVGAAGLGEEVFVEGSVVGECFAAFGWGAGDGHAGGAVGEGGAGWGGGLGAEEGDGFGGAAERGVGAGEVGERHVAAELGDELGGRTIYEIIGEFGGVDALEELEAEGLGVGGVGLALDGVFDGADDLFAGGGALGLGSGGFGGGGLCGCRGRSGDVLGEEDGAADGLGHPGVGEGAGGEGGVRRGRLALEGDAGADVDQDGQSALVGSVVRLRVGGGFGHEQKGNLLGLGVKG